MPTTGEMSWTVVGIEGLPIEPIESFLAYLAARQFSPNTVRTYSFALASYFEFLDGRSLDWESVRLEDVASFVGWLWRAAPNVIVLAPSASRLAPATVNKTLAAVSSFYEYQVRNGCEIAARLAT